MNRDQLNRPAGGERRREPAGSAREPWISRVSACKSLILERTAAARRAGSAMCRAVFATSPGFAPAAPALFFSLFNSLKKKKKDNREAVRTGPHRAPRVARVSPSVARAARFSRHESFRAATPE
ncbi:hypothetical protein [Burkholderia ubonensis]|uniref:Uncharacterized protein n=1 Tax=Burkholderia ubonensis subsp. mesacidophila TaxID=265293 RepID=A0A2A4FEM9_9BURK|nr:hypothetical protein [Burkholderia ubonensis]PCE31130.1 hypothetical protein BZL54_18060 [Burkholderia ubonensis subsp. mesacidophila]